MKKILYVHYQKNASEGSIVHVTRFSQAFREICQARQIEFNVIEPELIFRPPGDEGKPSVGTRIRRWLARNYLRDIKVLLQQLKLAWQERQLLQEYKPDIVLTRYDAETLSIHWACRTLNIPVVTEFNGKDRGELAGTYNSYKQFAALNRLFSNGNALAWSAGAMAVSDAIAADLRAANPQKKPVIVNHNGVNLDEFDPEIDAAPLRNSLGIPAAACVIGYVGSFIVWHAPDRLFRAFDKLVNEGLDVHLLLVGRKIPEVEAMIAKLNPASIKRIHMAGFVAHPDIPRHLAAMDIAVLPNTQPYCSPLKLFEYMAMRKACVAPSTETIQDILVDGQEGMLFAADDESAFTDALRKLAIDEGLRRQLGSAARQRVEKEFTWEHNAQRVMSLLEDASAWQNHKH